MGKNSRRAIKSALIVAAVYLNSEESWALERPMLLQTVDACTDTYIVAAQQDLSVPPCGRSLMVTMLILAMADAGHQGATGFCRHIVVGRAVFCRTNRTGGLDAARSGS